MKTCHTCKENKPLANFARTKTARDGLRSSCRSCSSAQALAWRTKNPDRHRANWRRFNLRQFGLSAEDYAALLGAQGDVCAVCATTDPGRGNGGQRKHFTVDHDHKTGRVRGLLCDRCNRVLGRMEDSPELLRRAALYLEGAAVDGYQ